MVLWGVWYQQVQCALFGCVWELAMADSLFIPAFRESESRQTIPKIFILKFAM